VKLLNNPIAAQAVVKLAPQKVFGMGFYSQHKRVLRKIIPTHLSSISLFLHINEPFLGTHEKDAVVRKLPSGSDEHEAGELRARLFRAGGH
jgi:hypothetical protein